ncbi:MAG: hypothetical protein AB1696_21760 [Planctomycetota bacterium]
MNKKHRLAGIVRAILLVALGMLTFILGSRVRVQTKAAGDRPAICAGCPLARECGAAKGSEEERKP